MEEGMHEHFNEWMVKIKEGQTDKQPDGELAGGSIDRLFEK